MFLRRMNRCSHPINCPALSGYTDKAIAVRKDSQRVSPLMVGLFRSTLLLPQMDLNEQQLAHILSHEMVHFRRKDLWYKWLISLVKCIHWFNPMIYLIARQIHLDCEISCDAVVVSSMTQEQRCGYVDTILSLLSSGNHQSIPLTTGMTGNKKTLKRRLMTMKHNVSMNQKTLLISLLLVICVIAVAVFAGGWMNGKMLDSFPTDITADERQNNHLNILVLGMDHQNRADSIAIFSLQERKLTGLFIPRDTAFSSSVSDGRVRKISDILSEEHGDQKVIAALRNAFSIPIHYYAKINLSAISEIVDVLGGIEMTVPMTMQYDDPQQNLHIDLQVGRQLLSGEQVCGLLQFRRSNEGIGYKDGDLSRISIAQNFVKALLDQKITVEYLDNVPDIYRILSENMVTNYPMEKISEDIETFWKVSEQELQSYTLPGEMITLEDHTVVYETNFEKAKEILQIYTTFVWPSESRTISKGFGSEEHPVTKEILEHNGIDIAAEQGSSVYSAIAGRVKTVGFDSERGNFVMIQNINDITTYYAHLGSVTVQEGDSVDLGESIGTVGQTGMATGPHLHFEIMLGNEYYDPQSFY